MTTIAYLLSDADTLLNETIRGVASPAFPRLTLLAGSTTTHTIQLRSFTARLTAIAATAERPAAAGRAAQGVAVPALPWLILLYGSAITLT